MIPILIIGTALVVVALVALTVAWKLRAASGLPSGRVVSSDMSGATRGKRLFSARYALSGTPDYLVETERGTVPVEVKPTRTEKEPHSSHLLQVLAYCLLVEDTTGKRPPYGLLRYSADTFKVEYNRETRNQLLSVMAEMREDAGRREVHRSHDAPGKCRACVYRGVCEESLV